MKGLAAAAVAGGANGVMTGFAAVGIDPMHFNLQSGLRPTLAIAGVSALMSSIIGVAAYLKQSPLPADELPPDFDARADRIDRDHRDGGDVRERRE